MFTSHSARRLKAAIIACSFSALIASPTALQLNAQDSLQSILHRIHEHTASEAWKQSGWKDERIELWLEKLTSDCAKVADLPDLKLPVRFANVTPGEALPDRGQQKTLLVGKNIDLQSADVYNAIVLADGNFIARSAQGCVIVARGAVELQNSEWSVIVAGTHVRIAERDGHITKPENGSLIGTRGRAQIQQAYGTVLFAAEGASISTSRSATFINAILIGSSMESSRSVKMKNLPIEELPVHPMAERMQFLGVIYPEAHDGNEFRLPSFLPGAKPLPQLTGIAFQFDNRRYIAEVGKPILDEADQTVVALADWRLSYANNSLAIFSSNDADAVVRIEK